MRLDARNRRQQLIAVAMRLFSERGFEGTTTRAIARAAGVNEAIIFRHFPTKEDLYWAVVSSRISAAGRKQMIERYVNSDLDQAEVLTGIAENLLTRTRKDAELTRLLLFSALRNADLSESFFHTYMAEAYDLLADYFRRCTRSGRLRKVNPVLAARGFLGMISNHILVQELFGGARYENFDPRQVGRELADIWLNGVGVRRRASGSGRDSNGSRKRGIPLSRSRAESVAAG
jgi:AcrR family transcriptional regulator